MMNITPKDLAIVSNSGSSERKQWDDTTGLVLHGIGTLYSNYFDIFTQQENFRDTWTVFIKYLETLLGWRSFEVSTSVFRVLSKVLDRVENADKLAVESRAEVWQLWSSQGVKLVEGVENSGNGIQETFTAYFDSFRSLYRLLESTLAASMVERALEIMEECVLFPDAPPYFQDSDMLTPLQASIIDCIKTIRTDIPSVPSILLKHVSSISTIAYRDLFPAATTTTSKPPRLPTCIALSTHCMNHLESISITHITNPEIYNTSALITVLAALETPIGLKYDFHPPHLSSAAKRPSQWITATNSALVILRRALPVLTTDATFSPQIPDPIKLDIWNSIITLAGSVIRASLPPATPTLRADESFDITAFRELRNLIIPWLGLSYLPDDTINRYIEAIFWSSRLYPFPTSEWSSADLGSTTELLLEPRNRCSYVCIDELFALVSSAAADAAPEPEKPLLRRVAGLAEPWLIRRVGIVLARYISDQPLRGRMPQPYPQRKEMLYMLQEMMRLDSGVEGHGKKAHLRKLFGLFTRCIRVAVGDQELLGLLAGALEVVEAGHA